MSLSNIKNFPDISPALFEKVILQNDLGGLNPIEKVEHIKNVCKTLGLNPLTKPIQLIKFQGKEIMYMGKDGTEQLRYNHNISIVKMETEYLNGSLYVVKAYAQTPSGRQDCSSSAISLDNLKGEAIGNAMKKCETQAKRRVTLSICGLGMLDESEIDDLPKPIFRQVLIEPKPVQSIQATKAIPTQQPQEEVVDNLKIEEEYDELELMIRECDSIDDLQKCFVLIKSRNFKSRPDLFKKLIDAKDSKKQELMVTEFNQEYDSTTGEINNDATL